MKMGDIELKNIKVRPAVVITETEDKYKDLVVSAVSSVLPSVLSPREIGVKESKLNNLRVESVIKADRIMTLKREDKIADLGRLSVKELSEFKRVLSGMIS